jgi:hypothetical protein
LVSTVRFDGNAEFLQAVARQARHPAHGADQCVEFDPLLGARVFDDDELLLALALAAQRLVAGQHLHAVGLQRFERQLRDVHVFAQQDAWRHFHLRHLRAQALEALRQLAADGAAAQHHHPARHLVELRKGVPQGVAGDIAHVVQPRQRRHDRARAGGDDDGAGASGSACRRR